MDPRKALNTVAGLCSKKEYCRQDIREKLESWEIPEEEISRILGFLVKNNFIDDRRFALAYARDKFRFNKWGKQKITLMLRQKKLSSEIIREATDRLQQEEYDETCTRLLLQKKQSLKEGDPLKNKNKLIRFALSRGFDYDTVRRCLQRPELRENGACNDSCTTAEWDG